MENYCNKKTFLSPLNPRSQLLYRASSVSDYLLKFLHPRNVNNKIRSCNYCFSLTRIVSNIVNFLSKPIERLNTPPPVSLLKNSINNSFLNKCREIL